MSQMQRLILSFGMCICASAASAEAEPAFMPKADTPSYVVKFLLPESKTRTDERTVHHSGGWTRIDQVRAGYPSTSFFGNGGKTAVTIWPEGPDRIRNISVRNGSAPATPGLDYNAVKTSERRVIAGESCEIWETMRSEARLRKESCVTEDGIELWYAYIGASGTFSSAQAVTVERRPLQPSDVQPPPDLLNFKAWIDADSGATQQSHPRDSTVVLKPKETASGFRTEAKTIRRHQDWTATETLRATGERILLLENSRSRLLFRFEERPGENRRSLSITQWPPDAGPSEPQQLDQKETVLGEECIWFDLMPNVMDASLAQCRTSEGIVLKETTGGRGSTQETLEAVHLRRRGVALSAVLPPDAILSRPYWGLPQ